jgi:hypothetical protein
LNPENDVFRLGRKPDPWMPPDWATAAPDGTFGNRFDDPHSTYRVLYASSQRLGCFLETLARFRPDPALMAELAEIAGENDFLPPGTVPVEWLRLRIMGRAAIAGEYADLCSSEWISRLRAELGLRTAVEFGIYDLDASALQNTSPRRLTHLVSRVVYNSGLDGIYYRSKYGHDVENWALFEPFKVSPRRSATVPPDDPELQRALVLHGLRLEGA